MESELAAALERCTVGKTFVLVHRRPPRASPQIVIDVVPLADLPSEFLAQMNAIQAPDAFTRWVVVFDFIEGGHPLFFDFAPRERPSA